MTEKASLVSRLGQWFKLPKRNGADNQPLSLELAAGQNDRSAPTTAPRFNLFRPWARRDAAIASLQQGFSTLTELMTAIRENLEKQNQRQDEMLNYLSHLPAILEELPESQRLHGETLKVVSQQLQQQIGQQNRLTEILDKVSDTGNGQKQILQSLHTEVEAVEMANRAIAENMRHMGSAMENVGRNSESTTQVLQQLHQTLATRDAETQTILKRQNTRTLVLLISAIALSVLAIAGAGAAIFMLVSNR